MVTKSEFTFWKGRNVLVTGGAGFIGYALATKLAAWGARVCVLDIKPSLPTHAISPHGMRKKITYIRGSVTSKKTVTGILRKKRVQTIFHLAAESIVGRAQRDPHICLEANIKGTWVLLECARAVGVSEILVASSDKAYGSHDELPYQEHAALKGLHPYDCSKSCADLIAQMYAHTFMLPVGIVRSGNVYGSGDTNWSRLIPDAFRSASRGTTLDIRSDGTFKRDYVYIDDAVDAYMTLATRVVKDRLHGEAFNFGNNKPLRVTDVLKELSRVAPKLKYEILNTAKKEIQHQYLDSSKARRLLSWRARTSFREGLQKAAAWYTAYFM
ncbi:MAG: SDR family NAD(P)-dependent oxidoreductase [bacterium]|nr:SDR family NAD(P)-dependent oxidoreductase [bacterium]